MKAVRTELPGILVIEPDVFKDPRGFFLESYHQRKYQEVGISQSFVQDNHSKSVKGTLRGLHAQVPHAQGKLVRVLQGEIWDVVVDVRKGSPTFGKWIGVNLSSDNFKQIYVPPNLLHGFCVLSETAEVEYKCTDFYDPASEVTVLWNDPEIGIQWPIQNPLLSKKDLAGVRLKDCLQKFPSFC